MYDQKGNKKSFNDSGFINNENDFNINYNHFKNDNFFIDASTLYSVHPQSFDQLKNTKDIDPYFIILKRDPFKRAVSHYLYSISRGEEFRQFDVALSDEINGKDEDWLLGGYLKGSDSSECERKIIKNWGKSRLITANIDSDDVFSETFFSTVIAFLNLHNFNFDFTTRANSLAFSQNKIIKEFRILLKRIRQLNPLLLDNKFTRTLFEKFMKAIPVSDKNIYEQFEMYKGQYEKLFYQNK